MAYNLQPQFGEVLTLIKSAQNRVITASNQELIKLYWSIGKYISDRIKTSQWGQKTIEQLAEFIQTQEPGIKGFEKRNLERMRQFYEIYPDSEITTALRTQLSWTHHRIIMSRCNTEDERLFYLQLATTERYSTRELERQIKPEYLGQLEFYLEALDRDVKKTYENPSIGVLLCRDKDEEVVEYALSRALSPTIVSEYEIKLIPKEILRRKLNEFYELLATRESGES
jgi:predicted nuclease of restriction endonuclease-like (RecB) superfamily